MQVLRLRLHAFVLDEEFPQVNLFNSTVFKLGQVLKAIVGNARELFEEEPLERFYLALADIRLRLTIFAVQIHQHLCLNDSGTRVHVEALVDLRIPLVFLRTYYQLDVITIGNDSFSEVGCVRGQYPEGRSLTQVGILALEN